MKKNIHKNIFKSKLALAVICLLSSITFANAQTVSKAEYFFDNDLGYGNNTLVTLTKATDSTWQLPVIPTAGLSVGYHHLYLRNKDSNGQWSQLTSMLIEITQSESLLRDSIIAAEYFIDSDPKFGSGKKITITLPDSSISKSITIPKSVFTSKSIGYHTLYTRFKDKLGRWSQTTSNRIELIKNEDSTTVVKVEYFFVDNSDLGFGSCNSKVITIAPPFINDTATFYIPYNQIPFVTNDTLFLRVKENINNRWSQTVYKGGLNITSVPRMLQNIANNSVNIYPNPATDHINIDLKNEATEPTEFKLIDMMGKEIQKQTLTEQSTTVKLNCPYGIYFVTLSNSTENIVKKLVLQNH